MVANISKYLTATEPICADNNLKMPGVKGRNEYMNNNQAQAVINLKLKVAVLFSNIFFNKAYQLFLSFTVDIQKTDTHAGIKLRL